MNSIVTRLYPTPPATLSLAGLYLRHDLRAREQAAPPYIYGNFVASLDGRIAQVDARTGQHAIPPALRHPHDWRLYLELAAQADAVLISGRRWRELCAAARPALDWVPGLARGDLADWRRHRGLAPQPACMVLTASLDLPLPGPRFGETVVVTGARAEPARVHRLREAGVDLVVSDNARVSGDEVHRAAAARGYATVYAVGGPEILHTLAAAGRVDRLYLAFVLRLLSGFAYDTLLRGEPFASPVALRLNEMYLDQPDAAHPALLFLSCDRATPVPPPAPARE